MQVTDSPGLGAELLETGALRRLDKSVVALLIVCT